MNMRKETEQSECTCGHIIAEHVHNGVFARDWYCTHCDCVGPRIRRVDEFVPPEDIRDRVADQIDEIDTEGI